MNNENQPMSPAEAPTDYVEWPVCVDEKVTPNKPETLHDPEYKFIHPVKMTDKEFSNPTLFIPDSYINDKDFKTIIIGVEEQFAALAEKGIEPQINQDDLYDILQMPFHSVFSDGDYQSWFKKNYGKVAQYIKTEHGVNIAITPLADKTYDPNNDFKGNMFKLAVQRATGTGGPLEIPLYNSGLVLEMDTFSPKEIADICVEFRYAKTQIGMSTKGITLSGDDVILNAIILERLLPKVTDCNLKGWTIQKLQSLIKASDLQTFKAGMLKVMYPLGYPIHYVCTNYLKDFAANGQSECNWSTSLSKKQKDGQISDYLSEGLMDFGKVVYPITNILNAYEKAFLSSGTVKRTQLEIEGYQKSVEDKLKIHFSDDITDNQSVNIWEDEHQKFILTFKTPTISQYIDGGKAWVNSINGIVDKALDTDSIVSENARSRKRAELLNTYTTVLAGLKIAPWIGKFDIVYKDGSPTKTATSQASICNGLESLTDAEGSIKKLEVGLKNYKSSSTLSAVGLPNFICPKCKQPQHVSDKDGFVSNTVIPLNLDGIFFTLMELKVLSQFQG